MAQVDVLFKVDVRLDSYSTIVVESGFSKVDIGVTLGTLAGMITNYVTTNFLDPRKETSQVYVPFSFGLVRGGRTVGTFLLDQKTNQPPGSDFTWSQSTIGQLRDQYDQAAPVKFIVYGEIKDLTRPQFAQDPREMEAWRARQASRRDATPPPGMVIPGADQQQTPPEEDEEDGMRIDLDPVTPFRSEKDLKRDAPEEFVFDDSPEKYVFEDDKRTLEEADKTVRRFGGSLGGGDDFELPEAYMDPKKRRVKCSMCKSKIGTLRYKGRKEVTFCGAACYHKGKKSASIQ